MVKAGALQTDLRGDSEEEGGREELMRFGARA